MQEEKVPGMKKRKGKRHLYTCLELKNTYQYLRSVPYLKPVYYPLSPW